MDWYTQAIPLRELGLSYNKIAKIVKKPVKTVQSRFKRDELRSEPTVKESLQVENLQDSILKELKNECTIKYLSDKYNKSERIICAVIEDIRECGYDIEDHGNTFWLNKVSFPKNSLIKEPWTGNTIVRFALIGDTHLNSIAQQLTHLNTFYDICQDEGIETIYHDGDLVDGDCVYPGHQFEVFNFGIDKQKEYAIKNYPCRKGITTKFIGGNHDLKWYHKSGADVCKGIASERKDMVYLGQYMARVELTPKCILQLEHPLGKPAYAISYKTQRKIDNMRGGLKPNILSEGHYHYSDYLFRRNVHAICTPSFQGPTTFSTRLGLENDNGGWIIEINVDDEGTITKFSPSFYPFYKVIEHDY